jgi:cytochrome P450
MLDPLSFSRSAAHSPSPSWHPIASSHSLNSSAEKRHRRHRLRSRRGLHPQKIAWAKLRALRDGAAIASKKLWRLNSKVLVGMNKQKAKN